MALGTGGNMFVYELEKRAPKCCSSFAGDGRSRR